jgi:hypothetical protein
MWNEMGSLAAWEIAAAIAWTVYCLEVWHQVRQPRRRQNLTAFGALWISGFLATFVLLTIVRIPPSRADTPSVVKAKPADDISKLANLASARY